MIAEKRKHFFSFFCIAGTLPASWGGQDAFASLSTLQLAYTSLTGQLPPEWGSNSSFQELSVLQIFNSSISGTDHLNPQLDFLTCSSKQITHLCAQACNLESCGTLVQQLLASLCSTPLHCVAAVLHYDSCVLVNRQYP